MTGEVRCDRRTIDPLPPHYAPRTPTLNTGNTDIFNLGFNCRALPYELGILYPQHRPCSNFTEADGTARPVEPMVIGHIYFRLCQ
jgi:hypothetical protein